MTQHPLALYYIVGVCLQLRMQRGFGARFSTAGCMFSRHINLRFLRQVQAYEWFEISCKVVNLELLLTAAVS
jgi:hypothetical protein